MKKKPRWLETRDSAPSLSKSRKNLRLLCANIAKRTLVEIVQILFCVSVSLKDHSLAISQNQFLMKLFHLPDADTVLKAVSTAINLRNLQVPGKVQQHSSGRIADLATDTSPAGMFSIPCKKGWNQSVWKVTYLKSTKKVEHLTESSAQKLIC